MLVMHTVRSGDTMHASDTHYACWWHSLCTLVALAVCAHSLCTLVALTVISGDTYCALWWHLLWTLVIVSEYNIGG